MKIKSVFIATALLFAGSMVFAPAGEAKAPKRSGKKPRTAAVTPAVKKTPKTLEKNGTSVAVTTYDAPAYYKVSKSEAGYSNGYCDNSFLIDWPTAVSKGDVNRLQQWLLEKFGGPDPAPSVDALIKHRNTCEYKSTRVSKIPKSDDETCLSDRAAITATLLTPDVLMYSQEYQGYFGGGTGASYMYGTSFYYYDLAKNREITADDMYSDSVVTVIVSQLKEDELWEDLWDEFKENPVATDNFALTPDKVIFIYPKYMIAAGYMGNVEVEVPVEQVLPYATPLMKTIVEEMRK